MIRLSKHFKSPKEAELYFSQQSTVNSLPPRFQEVSTQTETELTGTLGQIESLLQTLPEYQHGMALTRLIQALARNLAPGVRIRDNFVLLTIAAMKHLRECGRSNVVANLVKGLGTMHPDGCDSRIPAKRMPMEYVMKFFISDSMYEVSINNIDPITYVHDHSCLLNIFIHYL